MSIRQPHHVTVLCGVFIVITMDMSIAALATIRPTLRLNRKEVDRRLGYPGQLSTTFKQCVDRDSFVCLSGKNCILEAYRSPIVCILINKSTNIYDRIPK